MFCRHTFSHYPLFGVLYPYIVWHSWKWWTVLKDCVAISWKIARQKLHVVTENKTMQNLQNLHQIVTNQKPDLKNEVSAVFLTPHTSPPSNIVNNVCLQSQTIVLLELKIKEDNLNASKSNFKVFLLMAALTQPMT